MDVFSPEKRSWVMQRIRTRDTKPERVVRSMLHHLGFRFRLHRKTLPGKPDIQSVVGSRKASDVFAHGKARMQADVEARMALYGSAGKA